MTDTLIAQITSMEDEITRVEAEIADITTALTGVTDPSEICTCLMKRKSNLEANLAGYEAIKTEFENKLNLLIIGWSSERQTIVNGINSDFDDTYAVYLENLLRENDTAHQDEFFTLYAQANTTFLKETVLKEFFGIS